MTTPEGLGEQYHGPGEQSSDAIRDTGLPPDQAMRLTGPIGPSGPTAERVAMAQNQPMMQPDRYSHGWIKVGTGDDQALHGFDVEAKAEHHGHVYGKYDARTRTVLSMDGRTPVTHVRPADGGFRATAEYAADLQQGDDTHRFHAGLERLIGPFS